MRGQPSSYEQQFSRYGFWPNFGDLGPFLPNISSCPTLVICHESDIHSTYPKDDVHAKKHYAYWSDTITKIFHFDIQTIGSQINGGGQVTHFQGSQHDPPDPKMKFLGKNVEKWILGAI